MKKDIKTESGLTVGVDLGDRWIKYCVLDEHGQILEEDTVATTGRAFRKLFSDRTAARVVIEVGTHSPWVQRLLRELGHETVTANPRYVRLIYSSRNKNDKLDAERLARLARVDTKLLHPIQHRGGTAQADRALLRSRNALVECRTKLVNHARGIVKSVGGRLPSCSTTCFHKRVRQDLPDELKPALTPVLDTLAALTKKIQCFEARIARLAAKRYPETGHLRQVSGVGPLTSFSFVLTLEDPERFKHSRAVGSIWGCARGRVNPASRTRSCGSRKPATRTCGVCWSARHITSSGLSDPTPISDAGDSHSQHEGERTRRSVQWSPSHESSRCCCTDCGSRPRSTNLFGITNP